MRVGIHAYSCLKLDPIGRLFLVLSTSFDTRHALRRSSRQGPTKLMDRPCRAGEMAACKVGSAVGKCGTINRGWLPRFDCPSQMCGEEVPASGTHWRGPKEISTPTESH